MSNPIDTFLNKDNKPFPYTRFFIRLLDISMLGIYFMFFSIIYAVIVENTLTKLFSNYPNTIPNLIFEICIYASATMIMAYLIRKLISFIPFPLDGFYGYKHSRVSELKGGVIFAFSVFLLLTNFKNKLNILISDKLNLI